MSIQTLRIDGKSNRKRDGWALNYVCGGKDLLSGRVPNLDGGQPKARVKVVIIPRAKR